MDIHVNTTVEKARALAAKRRHFIAEAQATEWATGSDGPKGVALVRVLCEYAERAADAAEAWAMNPTVYFEVRMLADNRVFDLLLSDILRTRLEQG